jgi:hypothetical protein
VEMVPGTGRRRGRIGWVSRGRRAPLRFFECQATVV